MGIHSQIIDVLGGNGKLKAMINVKNLIVIDNGVRIIFSAKANKRINVIQIVLNGKDLYDVEFGRNVNRMDKEYGVRMPQYESVLEISDVYVENLKHTVEQEIGLYLSLI